MKQPGIYAIVNTINEEMYVGSTSDLRGRWWSHRHNLRKGKRQNPILLNAWKKYGEEAFVFQVLELIDHSDDRLELRKRLTEREQYYIDTLRPAYNVRPIAENNTGYHPRPESVEKMKISLTGLKRSQATKDLLRDARQGMKFSEEWCENIRIAKTETSPVTRERMSVAKKGKPPSKAAIEASVLTRKGKPRPPAVVAKIAASRKARYEQQKAEGQLPERNEITGRFKKSS